MSDPVELAKTIAQRAEVTSSSGEIREIDSIDLVNLVVELERALGREVPPDEVRAENFVSLAALSALIARMG